MKSTMIVAACAAAFALPVLAGDTPSPEGSRVYFVTPQDGATVPSPVTVVFGLAGMGVAPADVEKEYTGHHHLLIDRSPFGEGPDDAEMAETGIFADEGHAHFGGGQTEIAIDFAPGVHTLQLLLGDRNHVPHDPPVISEQITITVTE